MTLELQSVANAMGAPWEGPVRSVSGWSVDTRTQNSGDVYFALRGPVYDGHDFVGTALEKEAAAVVVEGGRPPSLPTNSICVPDTLVALQQLATWARLQWGGKVVAVTGSAGKTTTKDAIAHLLSSQLFVGKTIGNLNNHVGVPLSILRLPGESRAAVLEMGMNHAGEIRDLAAIARPDIGVVTNVGYAHVEYFDGIAGIAAAKRELIEGLAPDGVAVLNADDERVAAFARTHPGRSVTFGFAESADVRAEDADLRADGAKFRVRGVAFETGLAGRHAVMNLLAAIAVALEFGIAPEKLRDAVRTFSTGKMRGERIEYNGIVIWNDCYNSNPEAAQSMLDVLAETPAAKRIAVLGEMLELGAEADPLHRRVGRHAAGRGIDVLVGVRGAARAMVLAAEEAGLRSVYFEDPAEAGEFARIEAHPGDAVLFKGSRGVKVERALERFLA
jgi:UDP-N-acetylmuramoyl-tripeptide--D-alanyl-D-alanine ligase